MGKFIVTSFVVWRVVLIGIVLLAASVGPAIAQSIPEPFWRQGLPSWVWVWANFDGVHYVSIAKSGYLLNQQPFFPLYPFTIRYVNDILGLNHLQNGQIVSGQIISSVALIVSLFLMGKLLILDKKEKLFGYFLAAVFFFPTAFFYTAVYNDALFLLFASLTILWARQRRWVPASAAGALATLTRLNGLALLFFVLVEYADVNWRLTDWVSKIRIAFGRGNLRRSGILTVTAIPAAFVGYLLFVERSFGTWRWVFTSMEVWNQDKITFPLQVFWRYLKILFLDRSFSFTWYVAAMEFGFVFLYVCLLFYGIKKIRVSYWIFSVISLTIPMLTGTFSGMPRYILHLYPMFLIIGIFLSRIPKPIAIVLLMLGGIGQIVLLSLFSRGYFIS